MNWTQFKDPVSHMCLAGTVVAYWSLTQEVAASSPFTVMTNMLVTEFAEFSETFRKNSIVKGNIPNVGACHMHRSLSRPRPFLKADSCPN